jgi:hypothetical protein
MYQIDASGVATSLPTPAAAGTAGYFTNGNPATATPATVLDADFFNAVMMELLNVVSAASITPTKGTNNQVLAALQALFAPLSQTFGIGQSWQDVSGSRAAGTTYTNTTNRPVMVQVEATASGAGSFAIAASVGALGIANPSWSAPAAGYRGDATFIVPPGATYSCTLTNAALSSWKEFR